MVADDVEVLINDAGLSLYGRDALKQSTCHSSLATVHFESTHASPLVIRCTLSNTFLSDDLGGLTFVGDEAGISG